MTQQLLTIYDIFWQLIDCMQCFWKLIGCIQCLWHMTAYSLYIRFYKVPQYPGWAAHKNFAVLVMNGLWAFTYGAFLKILLYVGWLFEIYNKNLLDSNFCILFCFLNLDNVFNNVNTLILIRIDTQVLSISLSSRKAHIKSKFSYQLFQDNQAENFTANSWFVLWALRV